MVMGSNVLINNNLTYQASMLIEEIESKRIVGKQLAYFQILIKNTTKSPEINEEIMESSLTCVDQQTYLTNLKKAFMY